MGNLVRGNIEEKFTSAVLIKFIKNDSGDFESMSIIEASDSFCETVNLSRKDIINKDANIALSKIKNDKFNWAEILSDIVSNTEYQYIEVYSEIQKKCFKLLIAPQPENLLTIFFTDNTPEHLIANSATQFLNNTYEDIDYNDIVKTMSKISGAKYVALNQFNEDGKTFKTVAVNLAKNTLNNVKKYLGYNVLNKVWEYDEYKMQKTTSQKTTFFSGLDDLVKSVISKKTLKTISQLYNLSEVVIVNTTKNNQIIGDFTLMFTKDQKFANQKIAESYADLFGACITRLNAEQNIIKNKKELEDFFNSTQDLLAIIDSECNFIKYNNEWKSLLGYSETELINHSYYDLIHDDDISLTRKVLLNLRKSKKAQQIDIRIRSKNGDFRYIEVKLSINGDLIYLAARDITEYIETRSSLQRRVDDTNFLNSIAFQASDYPLNKDISHFLLKSLKDYAQAPYATFSTFNAEKQALFVKHILFDDSASTNKTVAQTIKKFNNTYIPIPKKEIKDILKFSIYPCNSLTELTFGAISKELDNKLKKATGLHTFYSLSYVDSGNIYGTAVLGFPKEHNKPHFDVLSSYIHVATLSLRKHSFEQETLNNKNQLNATINSISDGIISCDNNGNIISANKAAEMITGFNATNIIGKSIEKIYSKTKNKQNKNSINIVQNVLKSKETIRLSEPIIFTTGNENKCLIAQNCSPIINNEDEILGAVLVLRNVTEDFKQKEALKEREEKYTQLATQSRTFLWEINLEGVYTFVSDNCKDIIEYSADELINKKTFFDLFPKNLKEKYLEDIKPHQEKGEKLINFENALVTKSGKIIWVITNGIPIYDNDNNIIGFKGSDMDITQRKEYELEIKESEERFKALHNASFGGIAIHDKGIVIDCNKGLTDLTGFSREDLINKDGLKTIAPESLDKVNRNISQGYEKPYEAIGIRKDGTKYDLLISGKNIPYKGKQVRITEFRDISEYKKAQKKIKVSEEKYRQITENMSDVVFVADLNFELKYISPSIQDMVGETPEEHMKRTHEERFTPESLRKLMQIFHEELENEKKESKDNFRSRIIEVDHYKADGSTFPASMSVKFIRDEKGNAIGIQGTTRDITELKRVEEANRILASQYKALNDNLTVGTILIDRNLQIISINKKIKEWYNIRNNKELNTSCYKLFHNQNHICDTCPVLATFKDGKIKTYEKLLDLPDKSKMAVTVTTSPVYNDKNELVYVVEMIEDVTEKKEKEKALKESEERYRLISENSPVGLFQIAINNNNPQISYISEKAQELTGIPVEKIYKNMWDFEHIVSKKTLKKLTNVFNNSLKHGCELKTSFQYKNKNNEMRWLEVRANPKKLNNKSIIWNGVFVDITENKKLSEEIKLKSDFQKLISDVSWQFINANKDNIDDIINDMLLKCGEFLNVDRTFLFQFSEDLKIAYNTHEWCREGIMPAKDYLQQYPLDDAPIIKNLVEAKEMVFIPDIEKMKNSQEKEEFMKLQVKTVLCIPLVKKQTVLGYFGFDAVRSVKKIEEETIEFLKVLANILADALHQITIEKQILQAKEEAEAANAAKSQFLANMSHEIRTPLTAVLGFTDLLINTKLDDVQKQYVDNANKSAKSLLGIVTDILDFSKIEAGKMELEVVKTDIIQLIENTIDVVSYQAAKKGLEVLLTIHKTMPRYVYIDEIRLKQIIINLLSNAVKFTEKGEIELSIRCKRIDKNKAKFFISVTDTGIGISGEQKEKIFKVFSQADSSTTRKYGGTGLGLIISSHIAQKMDSKIDFISNPEEGSSFFFDFIADYEKKDSEKINLDGKINSVLLFQDNKKSTNSLKNILSKWDIKLKTISSKINHEIRISKNEFDLIIIDYNLFKQDAFQIVQQIRQQTGVTQEFMLLHSAAEEKSFYDKCNVNNITHKIVKPVKETELARKFEVIAGKNNEAENESINTVFENKEICADKVHNFLIVDDNPVNMMLIKVFIKNICSKAKVFEAKGGLEGISIYENNPIDLIFMDLQMPEINGIETTKRIRKIEKSKKKKKTPIIAITAEAMAEKKDECLKAGMNDFITKPIDAPKLMESMKNQLQKK